MEAMFLAIEEELRRGSPIGAWRQVLRGIGESQIAGLLVEVGERWPNVLVGSYPTFGAAGPTVELVLKSSDADALAAASGWLGDALEQRR
jgi:molybdopterin-biosynthesis enzyme MoeA-like protein